MPAKSVLSELIQCFGQESITDLGSLGNASFARGAFGEISIGLQRRCSRDSKEHYPSLVAIKTLYQSTVFGQAKLSPDAEAEIQALTSLCPHENTITLIALYPSRLDAFDSGDSLSMAFEYCPIDLYTSLEWRRRRCTPLLSFHTVRLISRDLLSALKHCHEHGFIHRDIKPGNLLASSRGIIKLCDFGLAKRVTWDCTAPSQNSTSSTTTANKSATEGPPLSRGKCTLNYRPPEVLLGGPANHFSVDMFSAGLVIAEALTGRTLFQGRNELDQLSKIFQYLGTPSDTNWPEAKSLPHGAQLHFTVQEPTPNTNIQELLFPRALECPGMVQLLRGLIALDPKKRRTARDCLDDNDNSDNSTFLSRAGLTNSDRARVREELIPTPLLEPFFLNDDSDDKAKQQALALATTRRAFLATLANWESRKERKL